MRVFISLIYIYAKITTYLIHTHAISPSPCFNFTVVPADIQWIKGDVLQVNTAALTGDSTPCKYPGTSGDIIPSGTTVVDGNGYGRVICTGSNTEIGIAQQAKR